jgi:hypothetical protein
MVSPNSPQPQVPPPPPLPHQLEIPADLLAPGGERGKELRHRAQLWTATALLSMVCVSSCCFALIGAILCHTAIQAVERGDVADAQAKLRWGKIVTLCGIALGLATGVGLILLYTVR